MQNTIESLLFRRYRTVLATISCAALLCLLAGCGLGPAAGPATAGNLTNQIAGKAMGGLQAIQGANVYLVYTGATGYGAGDVIGGTATTSMDTNGSFTITRNGATCTAPQQAYIVMQGGDTGGGANNQSLLVSAIGSCATLSTTSFVWVNEVTTVAAAYALGNFATTDGNAPYVHIGAPATNAAASGSTTAAAGLVHAFMNAANLAVCCGTTTGGAPQTNPTVSGMVNVIAPATMVNALADIAQSCVNSTGGSTTSSTPMFITPTPPSTTTAAYTSLVFSSTSAAINGDVNITYNGNALSGTISGATSPATFASAFNAIGSFASAVDTVSFTNPSTPTASAGSKATVSGISATTAVSGTVSISLAGGAPLTGTISSTSPATFVSSFNSNSAFSGAGIVASGASTVTITGPTGTANTLSFAGSSLTGSGNTLVATASGNIATISGLTGAANTLSISSTLSGTGSDGTSCGNLFALTPNIAGTMPNNIFQALANLAKNPWVSTANAASLWGAILPQMAYTPIPSAAPSDYTLGLSMQELPAAAPAGTSTVYPYRIALDANDAVYVLQPDLSSSPNAENVVSIGNYGGTAWNSSAVSAATSARGIAADSLGGLWIMGNASGTGNTNSFYEISASSGNLMAAHGIATGSGGNAYAVAVDRRNNIWISTQQPTNNLQELVNTNANPTAGATYATKSAIIGSTGTPGTIQSVANGGGGYGIAIDNFENVWTADYYGTTSSPTVIQYGNAVSVLPNVGTFAAPCYTSYNVSNTPACAVATGSNSATSSYQMAGTQGLSLVFDGGYVGTTPAQGTYNFNTLATDDYNQVATTGTPYGVQALNQFAVTQTIDSGGVLSVAVATATNIPGTSMGASYQQYAAMDGSGYTWLADFTAHGVLVSKNGAVFSESGGFNPCIQTAAIACSFGIGNARAGAVDSTGSYWVTSSGSIPSLVGVIQIIGTPSPAWPLLSVGKWGVQP